MRAAEGSIIVLLNDQRTVESAKILARIDQLLVRGFN